MNYTFYRIYSKNPSVTECYIGSTRDFNRRQYEHKRRCNNINNSHYTITLYQYMRNNGGIDEFEFEIIDTITFSNTDRLWHERKLIELFGAHLNTYRPIITNDEIIQASKNYNKIYNIINKEQIKQRYSEYRKRYRLDNADKINEKQRQKRLIQKQEKLSQSLSTMVI